MILTIHQPCYLPYLGIFHKIWKADEFVYLDDAQYSNGYVFEWNRIKTPQGECRLKIPLNRKFGMSLAEVSPKYELRWSEKHTKTVWMNYKKAPYFSELFPIYKKMIEHKFSNLAELNIALMDFFFEWFGLQKKTHRSSKFHLESRAEERVIEICKILDADAYLSGIGGRNYQKSEHFIQNGIELVYQEFRPIEYKQQWGAFAPYMSILDFAMNEGHDIDSHFKRMEEIIANGGE